MGRRKGRSNSCSKEERIEERERGRGGGGGERGEQQKKGEKKNEGFALRPVAANITKIFIEK